MIEITPLQPDQVDAAKHMIYGVAQRIFAPEQSVEAFIKETDSEHWLDDLDNYREIYNENRGLLLVVLDDGKVVGTGGVQKLKEEVAELKRIWLMEQYHGQKIGFRVVSMLLDFARQQGYTSVYLETSPQLTQAIAFYKKVGFSEIPSHHEDDFAMELKLYPTAGIT